MHASTLSPEEMREIAQQKQMALEILMGAFNDGVTDGLDEDCLSQAAIFCAFQAFVSTYGEEPVAKFAERLPDRIRNGEFTLQLHA